MKKHFYSSIITTDSLHIALESLEVSQEEKEHLEMLVDSSLYHTILNAILSELSESDKRLFLEQLLSENDDEILSFLSKKIDHIEDKIKTAADSLIEELHKDIEETKKK
ncbi:MAG TPA: hypothetical protein VFQ63_02860 [Patescibacteria group bacterium]|nr:hypothetical protein [Patescibacteria group bacterium]